MSEIAANARLVEISTMGRSQRIGSLIIESDVIMDEIADRLNTWPAKRRQGKLCPCEISETIGVAVAATQQKDEHIVGQVFDVVLDSMLRYDLGETAVID